MAAKKVGTLIKEARTNAGLTQEQLARRISGLSASDISMAERGKKELTQASLLNAAKGSTAKKTSSAGTKTMKVTATEKKLVELYRKADTDTKKAALNMLKGDEDLTELFLENLMDTVQDLFDGKI